MKKIVKTVLLLLFVLSISCSKKNEEHKLIDKKNDSLTTNNQIEKSSLEDEVTNIEEEIEENQENENDELISETLFEKWKGLYKLKQEDLSDGWGRESTSFSELNLVKPDSCVFKSWLADEKGKRYKTNDNYQEFIGVIYATINKDSIEFYTKKVISGGDNSLSPLLSITRGNEKHYIYSLLTSPPHNGVIKMDIKKIR